ncbi:component of SCAR regulatory complex [Reticulomyxa filosa]|uniref:Component of SCAR regulatory complex n=1 Tax=Reticulomyxa filosa TaxID=46433 RepID=X6MM33_RETFI|nr:component of SCAR regulatory complex [Reticulomyxa filosa]|eukprot:ETO15078.1 component of SCAR regulatory complex [Reticulomyxa filosa]
MTAITEIHNFLNDPSRPYHIILYHMKEDIRQVPHKEELFGALMTQALSDLNEHTYVTPAQKHGLHRSLLASMYLVDDGECNVFKGGKYIPIKEIRNLLRKAPYIPIYLDCTTRIELLLPLCEHYTSSMESDWNSKKNPLYYNLVNWRVRIQEEYTAYSAELVTLLHDLRSVKSDEQIPVPLLQHASNVLLQGFKFIGDWTSRVQEQVMFKANNPIDAAKYATFGGKGGKAEVYEQITRYNYENELKYAMVETIGLIKGLSNLLLENESFIKPVLARYVHEHLQEFSHNTLLLPLYRSHKKKKGDLNDTLLKIRLVIADCYDITKIREDFKKNKEKEIKKMEPHKWPARSVFPTRTQVLMLRRLLFHVYSEESKGMGGGFFADKDLKKEEKNAFESTFQLLGYVTYFQNFMDTVHNATNLSDLWFREFYLNLTDCIQFPIAMSLPWMLVDFAMNTPSLAPNVFFPLSIYNDSAEMALTVFHQQHLFDEIEAEVNLVFDQLIFTLYQKIFDYYKNKAASVLLDKPFQRRMEELRVQLGKNVMKLNYARYTPVFQQKCLHVLGRTVDTQALLTEQLNSYVRENIDAIISRYEVTNSISGVIEIEHLVSTLRLTVDFLREELPGIDPFDDMFNEINEDTTIGSYRGRLFLATYNQLFSGLLRTSVFNNTTRRFVSLERAKAMKRVENAFLWGSRFTKIYHELFKVTRGFFGIEHLHAIVSLMGIESMPLLVDEVVKTVAHVIIRDVSPYVTEILKALDPMKLQPAHYGVLGVYGFYDLRLKNIKEYPALREGVFNLMREAGNALCLVQMLDEVLTNESYYEHQIRAFFSGEEPAALSDDIKSQDSTKFTGAAAVASKPKESPLVTADKRGASMVKEQQLFESCIRNAMFRHAYLRENGGWLFGATLDYLHKLLEETKLLEEWKGPEPNNGILDHENPKDFARFWSVATWIFLCPDFSPEEEEKQKQQGYVPDRAYFGDGWLWAGTTILFLTGLRHRYRLLDPTIYLDKLQRLYPADLNPAPKAKGPFWKTKEVADPVMEGYKPFVRGLLAGWQEMEKNIDLITAVLESHFKTLQHPIDRFSPQWQEEKKNKTELQYDCTEVSFHENNLICANQIFKYFFTSENVKKVFLKNQRIYIFLK